MTHEEALCFNDPRAVFLTCPPKTVRQKRRTHSGHIPKIRHQARKKDSKYSLEALSFLVLELEGIEPAPLECHSKWLVHG